MSSSMGEEGRSGLSFEVVMMARKKTKGMCCLPKATLPDGWRAASWLSPVHGVLASKKESKKQKNQNCS